MDPEFYIFIVNQFKTEGTGNAPSAEVLTVLRDDPDRIKKNLENLLPDQLSVFCTKTKRAGRTVVKDDATYLVTQMAIDFAAEIASLSATDPVSA